MLSAHQAGANGVARQPVNSNRGSLVQLRVGPVRVEQRHSIIVCSAQGPEPSHSDESTDALRQKFFNQGPPQSTEQGASPPEANGANNEWPQRPPSPRLTRASSSNANELDNNPLDTVNPYALGRQARKAFDEVWTQLSNLASPTKSFIVDDVLEPGRDTEFEAPQAAYTTVLVVGATGRVGRVLTRKLLLRGYKVKALVRRKEGSKRDDYSASIPAAVEVVEGDVGDLDTCQLAMRGVSKVIFCAAARSTFTADLNRVEDQGMKNIVKALQDEAARNAQRERSRLFADDNSPEALRAKRRLYSDKSKKEIADFSQRYHQIRWDVTFVGTPEEREAMSAAAAAAAVADGSAKAAGLQKPAVERWVAASKATAAITEENHLIFQGELYQRSTYAEVGAKLHPRLPGGDHRTAGTEGIMMRVRGDGNAYICVLQTNKGHSYVARFPTRAGFLNVRLPYALFRSEKDGQPALEPADISFVALRYEAPRRPPAAVGGSRFARPGAAQSSASSVNDGKFEIEVDWIKAIAGGNEPDVVLVSTSRNARTDQLTDAEVERVVAAKRKGEENLRQSGLGYTIIRPGRLVDEPGGYRALTFDQGDRIDQPVSAADVADICLRSLHEPAARNKTFDVCFELPSVGGSSMYELVTSVPDKSGTYLKRATASMAKNT